MKNKINLYEIFHRNTKIQKAVINEKNFTYYYILRILNKYIDFKKHNNILDIGCGSGAISLYLANKGINNILGIDISKKSIKMCTLSAEKIKLKNTRFEVMDFPNRVPRITFDIVLCLEVIEHLKNDILALDKIYKLLKPGGTLILSTPSSNAPLFKLGMTQKFDYKVGHLRRYNPDYLIEIFNNIGFKVICLNKTEGILRNILFINQYLGGFIKFIRYPATHLIHFIDILFLKLFGESDLLIIAQKP